MLTAALLALGDLRLPAMRTALLRAVGLAGGLFALLLAGLGWLFAHAAASGVGWLDWLLDLAGGAAGLIAAILLFPATSAAILPFFLDPVAAAVEARHFRHLAPPRPATLFAQAAAGLWLALIGLAVGLALLPFVLFLPGLGLALYLVLNGWILGREYFELAALRRLDLARARAARRRARGQVWGLGVLLAALGLVPFGNLLVPLFGAALFVHVFHRCGGLAEMPPRV